MAENVKLNHIKEAHIIQALCYFFQLLPEQVIQFNQIKKAHDMETLDRQEKIMFSSATTVTIFLKIIHIEEALNIKVHITEQWGCFFQCN